MVDLSDKGSDSEEMSSKTPDRVSSEETLNQVKTCADCGTTKTPLWRGGPAGPKSLCNACGIRSRKKRRALLGLNKEDKDKDKKSKKNTSAAVTTTFNSNNNSQSEEGSSSNNDDGGNKLGRSLKRKLVALGKEVVLQRPRSTMTKQRRKMGEEEQAAMLLMALSCGSVFA